MAPAAARTSATISPTVQPLIPAKEAASGVAASCDCESTDAESFSADAAGGTEMLGTADGVAVGVEAASAGVPVSASPTAGA